AHCRPCGRAVRGTQRTTRAVRAPERLDAAPSAVLGGRGRIVTQPLPGGAMRVAALGLHHETNTFSSFPTTYETFGTSSYGGIWRDSEIEQNQRASHSTFAGYFQAA